MAYPLSPGRVALPLTRPHTSPSSSFVWLGPLGLHLGQCTLKYPMPLAVASKLNVQVYRLATAYSARACWCGHGSALGVDVAGMILHSFKATWKAIIIIWRNLFSNLGKYRVYVLGDVKTIVEAPR